MSKLQKLVDFAYMLGYPLRLLWLVLANYQCPRVVRAWGSLSYEYVSFQGILAGCIHATTM
eukprot:6027898-Pyramimonas_sp.AAC.1